MTAKKEKRSPVCCWEKNGNIGDIGRRKGLSGKKICPLKKENNEKRELGEKSSRGRSYPWGLLGARTK